MKLLSLLELNSNHSRFKECKVGLDNDYEELIEAFNPDLIMVEHIGENSEFTSFFEGFGKVVLNMIDYQKSCY